MNDGCLTAEERLVTVLALYWNTDEVDGVKLSF